MMWRQEQKYTISGADRVLLLCRLNASLLPDPYAAADGLYHVRTLYFDDIFQSALSDTFAGVPERKKYRLRMYNANPSFLRLERKTKSFNGGQKSSALLTQTECNLLIRGEYSFLKEKDDPFLLSAYAAAQSGGLRPQTIVDYSRNAFFHPTGNVRITVDENVRVSRNVDSFFDELFFGIPVLEKGACILEIKYDGILPVFIRELLSIENRTHTAMSKYAASGIFY